MIYLRAWSTLVFTTFRRLLWSTSTVMLLLPLAACALFVARRGFGRVADPLVAFNAFSNFLLFIYVPLIVPLCALAYGTTALSADREDRTLLFLLIRPLPRGLILSAKWCAAVPPAVCFACGGLWLLCRLAGPAGRDAFDAYLPTVFYLTPTYAAVFLLFATIFRHAVIASLVYALFMEILVGNVPGLLKQAAINYYGRSLMYDAGVAFGLSAPDPQWFDPLTGAEARTSLLGIGAFALATAWLVFTRREYDDA